MELWATLNWKHKFYMGTQNDMNLIELDFLFTPLNRRYTPYKLPHMFVQGFNVLFSNNTHLF